MSYEKEITQKIEQNEPLPKRLEISVLKYFWQSNPIMGKKVDSIPKFLRRIEVLKNFTENELRILAKFLHVRKFDAGEVIFNQSELGVGFYFIYSGYTDLIVSDTDSTSENKNEKKAKHVITLEKYDYFGELALLQQISTRSATAISRQGCELLGLFKPDVDQLINIYPLIAAKLLQSISLIVANRLFSITREVQELKYKINKLENNDSN
jgi:CRP/FNR family transcriptional regulator, cyclic AMP receptor protein